MRKLTCLFFVSFISCLSFAQNAASSDSGSRAKANKDSIKLEKLFGSAIYPVIKNSKFSGVLPVENIEDKADPSMRYKLLMEMVLWEKDSTAIGKLNAGLAEVGRLINLHVAAGVPKEHLDVVVVTHGSAMNAFLNNDRYRQKFHVDNPNNDILNQLKSFGTKFVACGQAMIYFDIPKEDMIPEMKKALSAQVVLSTYQLKGYTLYRITEDK